MWHRVGRYEHRTEVWGGKGGGMREGHKARLTESTVDSLLETQDLSVVWAQYRADEVHDRHAHTTTSVSLVVRGSVNEVVGGREEQGRPLSVVLKPSGVLHLDRFGPTGATLLRIGLRTALPRGSDSVRGEAFEWRWIHGGASARAMLSVLSAAHHGLHRREVHMGATDAIAAILEQVSVESPARDRQAPGWVRNVVTELDDTYVRPRSVADVASDHGVHPVYLARVFRRALGHSITVYVRRKRLSRAARMLAGSTTPISQIALDAGFADQSHLTRVFRSRTGITPAGFRRLASR